MSTATLDHASPETAHEWELVARAQDGDQDAFAELYDRYRDVVFRFVLYRLGNRADAEDATSETFTRALRRISTVSYMGRDVGAWFVTIARNLVLDMLKCSRSRLEVPVSLILDPETAWSAVNRWTIEDPERDAINVLLAELLNNAMTKLVPLQRQVITLRFAQGLSVSETAEVMDRNEGAVKALQHRAVVRLRQILGADTGLDLISA